MQMSHAGPKVCHPRTGPIRAMPRISSLMRLHGGDGDVDADEHDNPDVNGAQEDQGLEDRREGDCELDPRILAGTEEEIAPATGGVALRSFLDFVPDETVEDNVVKSLPNDEAGGEDGVGENHQPAAVPRADGGSLVPDKAGHNHDEHEVEYAADQEEEDGAEGVEDQGEDMCDEEPGEVNCQQFALDTPRAIVSVSNS